MSLPCEHIAAHEPAAPGGEGCRACLERGDRWVHLRVCTTCGEVACCDSSPNRHATRHARSTGHPVVRSYEPGEAWWWCYPDQVGVESVPGYPALKQG